MAAFGNRLRTAPWVSASAIIGAGLLVLAAFVVPLCADQKFRDRVVAGAAPIFGEFDAHVGPGTVPAVLFSIALVAYGPTLANRLPWRWVPAAASLALLVWTFLLALIDGWERGFAGKMAQWDEYPSQVSVAGSLPHMLATFDSRILAGQPDSWTVHTSGHPPGALATFLLLDRIGLGGGLSAGLWCVVTGATAAAAILVTVARLGTTDLARRCAPYLASFPGAVWIGVSADAYFMAVAAWALAALAFALTESGRRRYVYAAISGALFGWGLFLNYGLILLAIPAVALLALHYRRRDGRQIITTAGICVATLGLVVAAFALAGFWWLDGYFLVVERYYQGIASLRPFSYWGWANFASTLCAVGFVGAAGLAHAPAHLRGDRAGRACAWLAAGAFLAIVVADLSALSKAETERIWLPFTVWLMCGAALLPTARVRYWLTGQVAVALALNSLILTYR